VGRGARGTRMRLGYVIHHITRTRLLRLAVKKELLSGPLTVSRLVGVQPQGDVGRLHGLPHHPDEIIAECVEVGFVAKLGREGVQGLGSVVLAAVEAPIYEGLDAPPEGSEQRGDQERGCHDREGRLPARESDENPLQHYDDAEVEGDQHGGERAVDEGTVYDEVDLVEIVANDRYPYGDWEAYKGGHHNDE
jgi:hypothetical protein